MATLILQCDDLGGGHLARVLRDHGHRLRTVRLDQGQAPPSDLDDVGAVAILGRIAKDLPESVARMLADAHAASLPLIGLGDGAAAIASAIGGQSAAAESKGWRSVRLSTVGRDDAVLAGIAWTSMQFVAGSRAIAALPKSAKVLANFDDQSVAAFVAGLRTYGFLFRGELDLGSIRRTGGGDAETAANLPMAERIASRVFEAIATLVAPIDRANKGLVKDLHY